VITSGRLRSIRQKVITSGRLRSIRQQVITSGRVKEHQTESDNIRLS
jgi:hypothetical protein